MNTTNNIKKTVLYIFIVAVVLMTFVALLSVWGVLEDDVMWKSIVTIGILAAASGVIGYAADRLNDQKTVIHDFHQDNRSPKSVDNTNQPPNPNMIA